MAHKLVVPTIALFCFCLIRGHVFFKHKKWGGGKPPQRWLVGGKSPPKWYQLKLPSQSRISRGPELFLSLVTRSSLPGESGSLGLPLVFSLSLLVVH